MKVWTPKNDHFHDNTDSALFLSFSLPFDLILPENKDYVNTQRSNVTKLNLWHSLLTSKSEVGCEALSSHEKCFMRSKQEERSEQHTCNKNICVRMEWYTCMYIYVYNCIDVRNEYVYVYICIRCLFTCVWRIHQYCLTILARARHRQVRLRRAAV